jgi:Heterokaryon incompatibility protein (HET)
MPYNYEPLGEEQIRIVVLDPSPDQNSPLTCSIQHLTLDDNVKDYECISYAWGEPNFSKRLLCGDGSFEITPNLHAALTRFRSTRRKRALWADAVCINQKPDSDEKSRQIPLMDRIFHAASRVLVWLGSGGNEEDVAWLSRLTRLSSIVHAPDSDPRFLEVRLKGVFDANRARIPRLLALPWFSRRWIIQEVALNTDVDLYYGPAKISWPRFILALEIWARWLNSFPITEPPLKALLKLGGLWRAWCLLEDDPKDCGLLDLLDAFSDFKCAEPNDKVYALLGLATDVRSHLGQFGAPKISVTIDYSIPVEEVFRTITVDRMNSGRFFSTAADAAARRLSHPVRASSLPSWMPDPEARRRHTPIIYDIPGSPSPRVDFIERGRHLRLRGGVRSLNFCLPGNPANQNAITCSKLASRFFEAGKSHRRFLGWLRQSWGLLETDIISETRETAMRGFWNVVTGRSSLPGSVQDGGTAGSLIGRPFLGTTPISDVSDAHFPLLDMAAATMAGRRLFLGSPGQLVASGGFALGDSTNLTVLGIGPEDLAPGDLGVIFRGAVHPLFFRPCGYDRYWLLGDGAIVVLPAGSGHAQGEDLGIDENIDISLV